jgi:hypothetical protein
MLASFPKSSGDHGRILMVPFDGQFAESVMLPLAQAAYDSTQPPKGYVPDQTAFGIVANPHHPELQSRLSKLDPAEQSRRQRMLASMLEQPARPPEGALDSAEPRLAASAAPNLHLGWFCVDEPGSRLIVAFRGTRFIGDWLKDFDFLPAPYAPAPGGGTVHDGFQFVYLAVRENLIALVNKYSVGYEDILITGHSLGGALCALAAPDLLNSHPKLQPTVYTWAEPRVGKSDFAKFYDARVNICYRIVNLWDVVPHLPPELAAYEHEGIQVTIDSGFSFDVAHNHMLKTGYVPGMRKWNQNHPVQTTRQFGRMAVPALVGKVR